MIDVTVVLLEGSLPSTSMVPLEIFACAGSLWGTLMGTPSEPRFRVRTATIDGKKTQNLVPSRSSRASRSPTWGAPI